MARGKPFQPGTSGNPGGRPKGWKKMIEACRLETDANLELLRSLRDDPEVNPAVRAHCANSMLDRGWGKAPATVDVTHRSQRPARELTREELMSIAAQGLPAREKETEH